MLLSSLWFWQGSCERRTWTFFRPVWEGRTNTAYLSNLNKLPKANVRPYRTCPGPGCQDRVQMGARSCYFESTVLTEVRHIGKELPLLAPYLLQWDPHWAHPFSQKDGTYTGWAVSFRDMWVLIQGHQISSPVFFLHLYKWDWFGKADESKWTRTSIIHKSVNTYLPIKASERFLSA